MTVSGGVADELLHAVRAALAAYDIPPDCPIHPIRLTNNAVFEVRPDRAKRLVLRVHRPGYRSAAHIRSELRFLQVLGPRLNGTRISVPQPVLTLSGDLIVEVRVGSAREIRHCDVLTWIDGRELKPTRGLGPRSAFLLGEGLARIHDAAQGIERSPDFELPRWDAETMFSTVSPFQPGAMEEFLPAAAWPLFSEVARLTRAVFEQLDDTPNAWGVIHNDFILLNCDFARCADGWRLGLLDFDDLGWGYHLYDLAPLLGNLADFPDSYPKLRRAFLAGYRSIRLLPRSLEAHLPVLMAARHAATLAWLAGMHRRGETDLPIEQAHPVPRRRDAGLLGAAVDVEPNEGSPGGR